MGDHDLAGARSRLDGELRAARQQALHLARAVRASDPETISAIAVETSSRRSDCPARPPGRKICQRSINASSVNVLSGGLSNWVPGGNATRTPGTLSPMAGSFHITSCRSAPVYRNSRYAGRGTLAEQLNDLVRHTTAQLVVAGPVVAPRPQSCRTFMPVAFGQAQDLPARQSEPLSRPNRRQIAIDHGLYHLQSVQIPQLERHPGYQPHWRLPDPEKGSKTTEYHALGGHLNLAPTNYAVARYRCRGSG